MGVFDSGIGGLSVLAAAVHALPGCTFFYYGDNMHAPYGTRSAEEIGRFVRGALRKFSERGVDAAVIACNTATAACIGQARAEFMFPIVGMEPAVACAAGEGKRVLVLATPFTVRSKRLSELLARFPGTRFTVCAADRFAGAIEEHFLRKTPLTISDHLPQGHYDGVVLGCTHYVFFRREIADFYGCEVYDGVKGTVDRLRTILEHEKIGTGDHHCPHRNPNICFNQTWKKRRKNVIYFLGMNKNYNKRLFYTNICFTYI